MNIFGIRTAEFGDSDEHYVGEDGVLLYWLLANNYEPSDRDSQYLVNAPAGYEFHQGALFPKDSPELEGVAGNELRSTAYVSFGSPENDKAQMLLEGSLKHVGPAEFYTLNIDEDRILDYMIY